MSACSTVYDKVAHKRTNIASYYDEERQTLVIMRGIDLNWLCTILNAHYPTFKYAQPYVNMKYRYKVDQRPRSKDQVRAIKFLLGQAGNGAFSQLSLNAEPAFGKTYCATVAMLEKGARTIIICHTQTIKDQWKATLFNISNIPRDRVVDIDGGDKMNRMLEGEVDVDILLILHQTLIAYRNSEGINKAREWLKHIECGLKIIDEAHLFFKNTVEVDLLSDIQTTYYLTATMTRSDPLEVALFKRYFSLTASFGADLEKNKNVVFTFVDYNSYPEVEEQYYIMTKRGPNAAKFANYALNIDPDRTIIKVLLDVFKMAREHEGRTVIIASTVEECDVFCKVLQDEYPDLLIGASHSRNKQAHNDMVKQNADVVIATTTGLGTGADLKNLRTMIIFDLYTSEVTSNQLPKRLRPRPDGELSYCYEPVNCGFDAILSMVKKKTRFLKKSCHSVRHMTYPFE